jgi:hypothetical protein
MDKIKTDILTKLETESPVKRLMLLKYLTQCGHIITDRQMRKTIEEMIIKDGCRIGSHNSKGYFIIKSENELDEALKDLRTKAKSLFNRASKLVTNCDRIFEIKNQIEFHFK